jgi:hypothetical protein
MKGRQTERNKVIFKLSYFPLRKSGLASRFGTDAAKKKRRTNGVRPNTHGIEEDRKVTPPEAIQKAVGFDKFFGLCLDKGDHPLTAETFRATTWTFKQHQCRYERP